MCDYYLRQDEDLGKNPSNIRIVGELEAVNDSCDRAGTGPMLIQSTLAFRHANSASITGTVIPHRVAAEDTRA